MNTNKTQLNKQKKVSNLTKKDTFKVTCVHLPSGHMVHRYLGKHTLKLLQLKPRTVANIKCIYTHKCRRMCL